MDLNPQYLIQVEGWHGAIRQSEFEMLNPQDCVERLVESAFPPPHQPLHQCRECGILWPGDHQPACSQYTDHSVA